MVYGSKYVDITVSSPVREKLLPAVRAYAESGNDVDNDEIEALGFLTIRMTVREGKTTNQIWTKDPDQKLVYSGSTKWARRHSPQIMLGVYTDDDLERIKDEEKRKQTGSPSFGPSGEQSALPDGETKGKRKVAESKPEQPANEPKPDNNALSEADKAAILAQESATAGTDPTTKLDTLADMIAQDQITKDEFIVAAVDCGALRKAQSFSSIAEKKAEDLIKAYKAIQIAVANLREKNEVK